MVQRPPRAGAAAGRRRQQQQQQAGASTTALRVDTPAQLRPLLLAAPSAALDAAAIRALHLTSKLPAKLYDQLTAATRADTAAAGVGATSDGPPGSTRRLASLETLSLAGSRCGDAAVLALLPALSSHAKLSTLDVSGCCLTDACGVRLASLLKGQAGAAAQAAWARGLRAGSRRQRRCSCGPAAAGACRCCTVLSTAAAAAPGLRVLRAASNSLSGTSLAALAEAVADSFCCLQHLDVSFNPALPSPEHSARVLLAALCVEGGPPYRRLQVCLQQHSTLACAGTPIGSGSMAGAAGGTGSRPRGGKAASSSSSARCSRPPPVLAPTAPGVLLWRGVFTWPCSEEEEATAHGLRASPAVAATAVARAAVQPARSEGRPIAAATPAASPAAAAVGLLGPPGSEVAMPCTRDQPATSLHSDSSAAGSGHQSAAAARSPAQGMQGHRSQAVLHSEQEGSSCHAIWQQRRAARPAQQELAGADGPVTPELIQLAQSLGVLSDAVGQLEGLMYTGRRC